MDQIILENEKSLINDNDFHYWEKTKDIIDQLIDIIINYRQSGHPGGSRSKAHIFLSLLLSGVFRWDIRHPEKRFSDRFILSAGHTVPLVYCTLAVLHEAFRIKVQKTKNDKYTLDYPHSQPLYWQDLITFRRRGGLSGHAEMVGKTPIIKFNTGPSGHGTPAAAGEALALKRAGLGEVKVFFLEGEAGLTPGATHETLNSAWGMKLDNLILLLDWNDFGIDNHAVSDVVYGSPEDWIKSHGWYVKGTIQGSEWKHVVDTLVNVTNFQSENCQPKAAWFKTRKGRGYLKYDNYSHGSPHKMNSTLFWETKKTFAEKYNVKFSNFGGPPPQSEEELRHEFKSNLDAVIDVLRKDEELIDYLTEQLIKIGDCVPISLPTFNLGEDSNNPSHDQQFFDFENYPKDLFVDPGTRVANRKALSKWGSWVNGLSHHKYGRPLFIASSADLAGSTNISGFSESYNDYKGLGVYSLDGNHEGALLPQEITEFANAGIMVGLSSVNLAKNPEKIFNGFWGATSTYGSFSYLIYGMIRLYSQMCQDSPWKLGKVLWVAGHSGPETADDSRTHFGIFSPGVTQLFPRGHIINLHPWEYNEVPVLLGEALSKEVPIIALHLTRPPIIIPDRKKIGIPSYFEAAKGAYIVKDYKEGAVEDGTILVQGTSAMANLIEILPKLSKRNMNVKIVYVTSHELFQMQSDNYKEKVVSKTDKLNSTFITTQAKGLMKDWNFNFLAEEYALSADWDNKWLSGGTLDEVIDEAHLSQKWILRGIEKFVASKERRMRILREQLGET